MRATPRPSALPRSVLVGTVVVASLLVVAMAGVTLRESRRNYEDRARLTTQNLVKLLEQSLSDSISRIDLTLQTVADEINRELATGGLQGGELNAFMARQHARMPELESVRMVDAEGIVNYGVGVKPQAHVFVGDRDYYLRHRDDPNLNLFLSKPLLSRISGKWVIIFARRLNRPDGTFNGAVYAPIALEHFSELFSKIEVGPNGAITIRDAQMGILVRYPVPKGVENPLGNTSMAKDLREFIQAGHSEGTFTLVAPFDQIRRTISFRKVPKYDLVISVGLAAKDYLVEWRREALKTGGLSALFILLILAGSRLLDSAWKQELASVETLKAMFDSANVGISISDMEGQVVQSNARWAEFLGYPVGEVERLSDMDITLPEDREESWNRMQALKGRELRSYSQEKRFLRKDGQIAWGFLSVTPVWENSKHMKFLVRMVADISEQKKAENLKHQFVSVVSHELRTPLTSIRGALGLLGGGLGGPLTPKAMELIQIANKNVERLILLVNDILDIDKIQSGLINLTKETLDLDLLVKDALQAHQGYAQERDVTLALTSELPGVLVQADPHRLMQVLANLLSNATKFSPAGGQVEVGLTRRDGWVRVFIQDHGQGIPADFRPHLFLPFRQADSSDTRSKGGSGLGLSITRPLVEQMGGLLGFESVEGEGATFWFELRETKANA